MEWNDIYDENRILTGRRHLRGTPWLPGEFGLVVCVWVYDGRGNILLTRRAPEKVFAGTLLSVEQATKVVNKYQNEAYTTSPLESPYRDRGESLD